MHLNSVITARLTADRHVKPVNQLYVSLTLLNIEIEIKISTLEMESHSTIRPDEGHFWLHFYGPVVDLSQSSTDFKLRDFVKLLDRSLQ